MKRSKRSPNGASRQIKSRTKSENLVVQQQRRIDLRSLRQEPIGQREPKQKVSPVHTNTKQSGGANAGNDPRASHVKATPCQAENQILGRGTINCSVYDQPIPIHDRKVTPKYNRQCIFGGKACLYWKGNDKNWQPGPRNASFFDTELRDSSGINSGIWNNKD